MFKTLKKIKKQIECKVKAKQAVKTRKAGALGVILGGLIGGVAALLTSKHNGAQNRAILSKKATEIKQKTTQIIKNASKEADKAKSRIGGAINDSNIKENIEETVEKVKGGFGDAVDRIKGALTKNKNDESKDAEK